MSDQLLTNDDLVDNDKSCGFFYSLKFMNVAMVTILKNITNLITACGEIYYFGKHHNNKVWGSLGLMVCLQSSLLVFALLCLISTLSSADFGF